MININRSKKAGGSETRGADQKAGHLIYSKLPEKQKVVLNKINEKSELNDADQKAERKRRIRAINPKHETW